MVTEITSLRHPGVEVFGTLTEAQLRNRLEPEKGVFIAESPKVIAVALDAGYEPVSLLCERRHIDGDAAPIIARCGDIPVYTGCWPSSRATRSRAACCAPCDARHCLQWSRCAATRDAWW